MRVNTMSLLTACLIVKNESANLARCLESVRGVVDEVVVVDTGSTDETVALAERLGARVFHHVWQHDFALARNAGLDHARGEWILHLDADEALTPETRASLRATIEARAHEADAFTVVMHHFTTDQVLVDHLESHEVRVFRNRSDYRFELNLHTQVLPSILRAGGRVRPTALRIWHYGYLSANAQGGDRLARNAALLEAEAARRPTDPYTAAKLGLTYQSLGRWEEAEHWLKRVWSDYDLSHTNVDVLIQTLAALAATAESRGDLENARRYAQMGLQLDEGGNLRPTLLALAANADLHLGLNALSATLKGVHAGDLSDAQARPQLPSVRAALARAVDGYAELLGNSDVRETHRLDLADRACMAGAQLDLADRLMARLTGQPPTYPSDWRPRTTEARRQAVAPAILGAVTGYGWPVLAPFVESWRRCAPTARLVLFVSRIPNETLSELHARGVALEPFETRPGVSVNVQRYGLYAAWLEAHPEVDHALLCDVRDVVFQRDPFAAPLPDALTVALEDPLGTLGSDGPNAIWLRALAGPQAWWRLAGKPISCSGTVLGPRLALQHYLALMAHTLAQAPSGDPQFNGIDQGAHNLLLHAGVLPEPHWLRNGRLIYTVGYLLPDALHVNADGDITAPGGAVPAIVHQYDRHLLLRDHVTRRFSSAGVIEG
jgi:tetratricopeptide (TPR) repeat protein